MVNSAPLVHRESSNSNGASLSPCGRYRYALTRGDWLDGEGTVLFVMLNPSTADASVDDPTIRRCIGFARRWGYARLTVGNLYALRATDPRALAVAEDPVGAGCDEWLDKLAQNATEAIAAWGANAVIDPVRADHVRDLVEFQVGSMRCLGQTQSLAPRHPLYVRGDAPRVPLKRYGRVA